MTEVCEKAILLYLSTSEDSIIEDTYPWSISQNLDHVDVIGAIKSLLVDEYVTIMKDIQTSFYILQTEGQQIMNYGSQEMIVLKTLIDNNNNNNAAGGDDVNIITISKLQELVGKDVAKIGMANCMKNKWIKKDGANLIPLIQSMNDVVDDVQIALKQLHDHNYQQNAIDTKTSTMLMKRKLIKLQTRKSLKIQRGISYQPIRTKKAADLTKEMLDNNEWKTSEFKTYNFITYGEKCTNSGYLHPLLKVRTEFRKILISMGFYEMPTNQWIESSFWNFDALFQPQSHPARDSHDTFFIQYPATTIQIPEDYYERVKAMHEYGADTESIGYRYKFQRHEAMKNLLRTHTTAISSQMLYRLAKECNKTNQKQNEDGTITTTTNVFTPVKYFSIDRVFRNETMDATHLCEFHQVEGLVADYNLSLADLIGTIKTFFHKIGITQLRFKPAYNPYTEPSMEIFGYHPDLQKWTEIGNSGMFRPEMLQPMGLPPNVRVIAWGLSLERPTMIKYRIKNIRDLFGHKVELSRTKNAPICRF